MKNLGFKCSMCGKCCKSGGPTLSVDEIFAFQKDFIILGCMKAYFVDSEKMTDDEKKKNPCIINLTDNDGNQYEISLLIGFKTFNLKRKCDMLRKDGKCELHLKKNQRLPLACTTVPLMPFVDEKDTWTYFTKGEGKEFVKRWKCVKQNPKEKDYIIFWNEGLFENSSDLVKSYQKELNDLTKEVTDNLSLFCNMIGQENFPIKVNDIIDLAISSFYGAEKTLTFSPTIVLFPIDMDITHREVFFKNKYARSNSAVAEFYRSQLLLIEKLDFSDVSAEYKNELLSYRIAYKNALEYAAGSPVMGKKNFDDNDIFDIF